MGLTRMNNTLNVFAEISKIDEEQRMVYGYASTEALDHQGERVAKEAIERALPDYMKFGNIREMHSDSAVGVAEEATIDNKGLYIAAKVVDDNAWKKVKEKVYKGFSIGGKRISKVADTITKLKLTEISLVDRPANPEATFDLYKADVVSQEEIIEPQTVEATPVENAPSLENEKQTEEKPTCQENSEEVVEKVASREDVNPKEGEKKYGKVKFADTKNKKYPIDTEEHIRAAWNYIHQKHNAAKYSAEDLASIRRKIIAAWKQKIDEKGPPEATEKTITAHMTKGLYEVSQLACMLNNLDALEDMVSMEARAEGDNSLIPQRLIEAINTLGDILRDMVDEEVEEMQSDENEEESNSIAYSETSEDLKKSEISGLKNDLSKLASMFEKISNENANLEKRIKELEALPMPAKAAVKVIGKQEDSNDLHKREELNNPLSIIKSIHQTGGRPL